VIYEIFIYDKWGKLMFQSQNPNMGWNGTSLDGREVQPGVYVYAIKAHEIITGNDLSTSGTVTLVK
jgi:gliding motility-associated-like protein